MRLLHFDPAGVFDDAVGITPEQLASISEPLALLRDGMLQASTTTWTGGLRLPEKLLTDYELTRGKSELGRVFRVANRLHDHIDAVVVVGDQDSLLGPAALMRACCEPYHNELSRAARGSKPRMYFAPADFDNDAADGLLRRLKTGGSGPDATERRHAIIAIDSHIGCANSSFATSASMELIGDQLTESLGDGASRWLPKLMIPISPATGPVRKLADRFGCEHDFQFDSGLGGPLGIYSPANLLPSALLGLDCIQFLVGAAAMNDHFLKACFADNAVMQFVAMQIAMTQFRGAVSSPLRVWNPAFNGYASWWERFSRKPSAGCEMSLGNGVTHHLCVDAARTDHLSVHSCEVASGFGDEMLPASYRGKQSKSLTLPDLMQASMAKTIADQRGAGQPATRLILPNIDMHSLGQLFQFTWLARECLGGIGSRGASVQ